jgi:hypothetical protein
MKMDLMTIVLILIGLVVVWAALRVFFKLTARLFTLGCVGLFILVGGIWLISTVL